MAFLLKRAYEGYFWLMNDVADPRALNFPLMGSPIPIIIITYVWLKFILNWGPEYMKNRKPFDLKRIMIFYNIFQVVSNVYIVYNAILARNVIDWKCGEIDYSESYWGMKFLRVTHFYFFLKIADLLDTVFFVLRKKDSHLTFLHIYHHFGMVLTTWLGAKFVGGGHSYFLGLANGIVHVILYSYYLLTAYDSKFGKLIWLKKFITQAQLVQFAFIICSFGQLLFRKNCNYPIVVALFIIPQDIFMIILFGDFYVRTYILAPKKKKLAQQAAEQKQDS